MFLWIVLAISLLFAGCFLLQSLAMYLQPGTAKRPTQASARVLVPELIALEAQFFLAPRLAIDEARQLLREIGPPLDPFSGVSDLPSFSRALRQSQHFIRGRAQPVTATEEPQD